MQFAKSSITLEGALYCFCPFYRLAIGLDTNGDKAMARWYSYTCEVEIDWSGV